MHVGHEQERSLVRRELPVVPGGDSLLGQHQRHTVLREGAGVAAVELARKLVEHQNLRQPSLRRGAPMEGLAERDLFMGFGEPVGQLGVELGLGGEPVVAAVFDEPEFEDVFGSTHMSWIAPRGAGGKERIAAVSWYRLHGSFAIAESIWPIRGGSTCDWSSSTGTTARFTSTLSTWWRCARRCATPRWRPLPACIRFTATRRRSPGSSAPKNCRSTSPRRS